MKAACVTVPALGIFTIINFVLTSIVGAFDSFTGYEARHKRQAEVLLLWSGRSVNNKPCCLSRRSAGKRHSQRHESGGSRNGQKTPMVLLTRADDLVTI